MSEDIQNLMKKFENMINSNSIPNDVKEALGKIEDKPKGSDASNGSSFDPSKISPEMISTFANMLGNSASSNSNGEKPNIDIDMIMKMKPMLEKMNSKTDPRSNLLLSLKPYLKESRKGKVEQYVNLLNMAKVMDVFNNTGGAKK